MTAIPPDPRAELPLRFPEAVKHDPAIDTWLLSLRDDLRPLAERWFEEMRRCGDDVRELLHDGRPTACVEDAAFGYVGVARQHVTVGFFFGALLPDPAGLLEGSGRRGRHVKLRPGRPFESDALVRLIQDAYRDMRVRLEDLS